MVRPALSICIWLVVCTLTLGLALGASAGILGTYVEQGDAPALLPAQHTLGNAPALDVILGSYLDIDDQDLYLIEITDPSIFEAAVESIEADTQVFLFDASGLGIAANDDALIVNLNTNLFNVFAFNSLLPAGNALYANLPAGQYVIGVSTWDRDPFSAGGAIFPNSFNTVGPTGPGAGQAVSSWVSLNDFDDNFFLNATTADYTIRLTGANFVPEPGTALAGGLAILGALALARRARL